MSDRTETTADRLRIQKQPQRQDSLQDQLEDLHVLAVRVGMYDAADWLWKVGLMKKEATPRVS